MTDHEGIQGLWRIMSWTSRSHPVTSGSTHYQFEGSRVKQITPSLVEGGSWATFELDPESTPKRFTATYTFPNPDGQSTFQVHRDAYSLDGDLLQICVSNVWGSYPDAFSDAEHQIITLARDRGPLPETKRPTNKAPIEDATFGQLSWDDDLDEWRAQIQLNLGHSVECTVSPGDQPDTKVVALLRDFVEWYRKNDEGARSYAADRLRDTYNDHWNQGSAIAKRTFRDRIRLDAICLYSTGNAELYFHDGGMFRGHCIVVSLSEQRDFKQATIAG